MSDFTTANIRKAGIKTIGGQGQSRYPTNAPLKGITRTLAFAVPFAAIGKPRMTQSDKWKHRPPVMAYRRWCDRLREAAPKPLPPAERILSITLRCEFQPPESWSKLKRLEAIGKPKRTKPDLDNAVKGVFDALWENDEAIPGLGASKWYAEKDSILVQMEFEE